MVTKDRQRLAKRLVLAFVGGLGVEDVAQAVAEEVERHEQGRKRAGREQDHPPVNAHRVDLRRTLGDQRAKTRLWRWMPSPR